MTFGVDNLGDLPGLAPKLLVPITSPGIAQGETDTTRTNATVVGSGRQTLTSNVWTVSGITGAAMLKLDLCVVDGSIEIHRREWTGY